MRRFIFILLLLIASVWVGLKIAADPGYALFSYRYWSVEMPLWFAVLAFFLIIFSMYLMLHLFETMDISFYRFKNWLRWRRKNKAYSKTNRGLIELIEARWRSAEYYLLEGIAQSDAPLVNYLAAAKAADEQGAFDRRDNHLRKAHDCSPRAEIPIGLTQAQLQLNQGQLEQALATLKHLYSIAPRHELVLSLLHKLYIRLSDWASLLTLSPNLRKAKVLTAEQADKLEQVCYQELLLAAANNKSQGLNAVRGEWQKIPKKFHTDPLVLACYTNIMKQDSGMSDELESLISKTLKKVWNDDLVRDYGLLMTSNVKTQLEHGENWLKRRPQDPILLLTMGRLCVRCQLWGRARSFFEESIKLSPQPVAYLEYGKLLEQLGEMDAALKSYRDGLVR